MKRIGIILFLIQWGSMVTAQNTVLEPGVYYYTVADCFLNKDYKGTFKADSVAAQNQFKGTRIWRTVSLENPMNKMVFNSNKNCLEIGLLELIKFGLLAKNLNAFSSDDFSKVNNTHLNQLQVKNELSYLDTTITLSFDAMGNETKTPSKTLRYLMDEDVKSYLLKEDWVFNSKSGETEKHIVAFAPLVYNQKSGKVHPLFWLYYPEWRELLASFEAKNVYSYDRITFYQLLERRYFVSQINKESNVFDRSIKESKRGSDIMLENELIKEKLHNSESDLFEH